MTTATGILRDEHKAILKMLDAAEEVAKRIKRRKFPSPEIPSGLLEFFRTFADRCHHGKEEDCLFPLLEKKGLPREGGPIGAMLHEHAHGRELIRNMVEALEVTHDHPEGRWLAWSDAALSYVALLRDHIAKENDILFAMADRLLSESEQTALVDAFDRVEISKLGAGTHERLHRLMEKLHAEIFSHPT